MGFWDEISVRASVRREEISVSAGVRCVGINLREGVYSDGSSFELGISGCWMIECSEKTVGLKIGVRARKKGECFMHSPCFLAEM